MKTRLFQHSQWTKLGSSVGVVLLALLLCSGSFTDLDAQQYMKNLGTRELEFSTEMTPTSDGNYVTVGPVRRPRSQGPGFDIYLNKITPAGGLLWSQKIVDATNDPLGSSFPRSVTKTSDSGGPTGFAITGVNHNDRQYPIFIVRTDNNGNPLWYKAYGGPVPSPHVRIISGVGAKIRYVDWQDTSIDELPAELVVCGSVILSKQDNIAGTSQRVGQVPFLLATDLDGNQRFLKLYHDVTHSDPKPFGYRQGGHFADVEVVTEFQEVWYTDENGMNRDRTFAPGYVVTGHFGDFFSRSARDAAIVVRTDYTGFVYTQGKYWWGQEGTSTRGTAISLGTSQGGMFAYTIAGRVRQDNQPPATFVLEVEAGLEVPGGFPLIPMLYEGFITLGDIRTIAGSSTGNYEFVLAGRDAHAPDAALLRIRNLNNMIFANGYGGSHFEFFTDAHEMHSSDLFASGGTTTWCRGPADEYLTRTTANGAVSGCPVYPLETQPVTIAFERSNPEYRWVDLEGPQKRHPKVPDPDTLVQLICPHKLVAVPTIPWDWFIRSDFNRDMKLDITDPIETLHHLFAGKEASVPEEASDSNADGVTDLSDAVYGLLHLFRGGPPPSPPFEEPGPDPKNDRVNVFSLEELRELLETGDDTVPHDADWLGGFDLERTTVPTGGQEGESLKG